MATVQYGYTKGNRLEEVDEATGGGAPAQTVDVNIATGQKKLDILIALDLIKQKVIQSKVFAP